MRPPDSRPQIDAIITIAPPPRARMCGTASARRADGGEHRLVERRLPFGVGGPEQIAARGAADVVHQDVDAAERLDRPRRRPAAIPPAVDTSACTASTRCGVRRGGLRPRRARPASRSAPRAQRHTRQPSAASALALASPSPRLEPVTMAILSSSSRCIGSTSRLPTTDSRLPTDFDRPVKSLSRQSNWWNCILNSFFCSSLLLERQQVRHDERDDRPLDRRALGEGPGRARDRRRRRTRRRAS